MPTSNRIHITQSAANNSTVRSMQQLDPARRFREPHSRSYGLSKLSFLPEHLFEQRLLSVWCRTAEVLGAHAHVRFVESQPFRGDLEQTRDRVGACAGSCHSTSELREVELAAAHSRYR